MSTPQTQFATLIIPETKDRKTDFKNIAAKYLYHWPLFLVFLVFFTLAAILYVQFAQPTYEVKASLLIKDEKKAPEQQSALQEIDLVGSSKLLENEIELLKSRRLINQVVNELQLNIIYQEKDGLKTIDLYKTSPVKLTVLKSNRTKEPEFNITINDKNTFLLKDKNGDIKKLSFNKPYTNSFGTWKLEPTENILSFKDSKIKITLLDPELVTLQYQKNIEVSPVNKLATAVVLTLTDQVAQRGEDILNQLLLNYNLANKQEKERETQKTLAFLDQRLDSLSSELTLAEKGIESFKSSRGLTDINVESKINLENLQANDSRLNEVNVQLSIIKGIEDYVNSSRNLGNAPATFGIADPALSNLIEKLSDLQLQRDRLLATSPETNPDFEPINRQITTTRAAIRENVRNIKSSLLNARAKLESYNTGFESSIRNIPTQERQLISIKRQQAIQESLYTYLLQKREEIAVNYANTIFNDRMVDPAYAGPAKEPKKAIAFAFALLMGICLPAGIIYGRDTLNYSIVDSQEIKDAVDIPIIAEIPHGKTGELISIKNPGTNAISEQLRALRINLHYLYGESENGRVTLVTSSISGEGKSYISSNLGLTFAHMERKTVILELDLRKPKVAETFKLKREHPGITEYLNNKATLANIIRESGLDPNLHIISSGAIVNNPSELLEKEQLKSLISSLRDVYDYIIIDSPPLHLVPDALVLSRLSDSTLYVIKQGTTQKYELDFLKDLYDKKQLSNIQIVFNGVQSSKYGYGYNYSTSYYNEKEKESIFSDFWKRF